jgi:hypothetical protein
MSAGIVRVKRYRSEEKLERGLAEMEALGWNVEDHATRTLWYSGFFKDRKLHVVTYSR